MAISAFIGILNYDKTVKLISCQYDGYPSRGTGLNLIKYFDSLESAQKIVSDGNRDCLVPHKNKEVRFYKYDPIFEYDNWDEFKKELKNHPHTYIYVWNVPVNRWEFLDTENIDLINLTDLKKFLNLKEGKE